MQLKKLGKPEIKKNKGVNLDVKLHTKLKHKIISYYFSGGWKNAFKSGKIYSLYYVDLFAGDGFCICNELDEELEKYLPGDLSKRKWKPSFFSLMNYAKQADFNLKCIFNDLNESNINSLKKEINSEGYSYFVKAYCCKDANILCDDILDKIEKPNRPSLFFIDPTNHNQLQFKTIEKIANFKDKKTGRMPELIINFMLNSIFMAMKRGMSEGDLKSINSFLGTKLSMEDILKIINDDSEKTYKTLLNIFLYNLKKLGYQCNYHLITSAKNQAPIYYLIFATYSKDVFLWYSNINNYVRNLEEDWVRKNYTIKTMTDAKKKGQTFLDV